MNNLLDGLGIDLLALVDVVTYLEARYGLAIPSEQALAWRTVGDIVAYIEQYASKDAA